MNFLHPFLLNKPIHLAFEMFSKLILDTRDIHFIEANK